MFFFGGEGWGGLENLYQQSFVNVHTHSDLSIERRHTHLNKLQVQLSTAKHAVAPHDTRKFSAFESSKSNDLKPKTIEISLKHNQPTLVLVKKCSSETCFMDFRLFP